MTATVEVITVHSLDERRVPQARALQRKGMTFTEIAQTMRVPREEVVQALYWDLVEREK